MAHRLVTCWWCHWLIHRWQPIGMWQDCNLKFSCSTLSNFNIGHPTFVGQPITNEHPAYAHLPEAFDARAMAKKLEQTNVNVATVWKTFPRSASDTSPLRPVPAGALKGFYSARNLSVFWRIGTRQIITQCFMDVSIHLARCGIVWTCPMCVHGTHTLIHTVRTF